ncbi:MAG TPA: hypothetical protein PLX85_08405, partial [Dehalococcoidia bacterium]|nr:hypothetical protein [Dehalococcoidia bacterium]
VCSLPNATPACTNGSCSIASCANNFANCDGVAGNGCEINTQIDPTHCGNCATVCSVANGTPGCAAGA